MSMHVVGGTSLADLDAFVADNPGKGFVLVCDRTAETLSIPGDKAEHFMDVTYTQDCYPEWVEKLGWKLDFTDDGEPIDIGPKACA